MFSSSPRETCSLCTIEPHDIFPSGSVIFWIPHIPYDGSDMADLWNSLLAPRFSIYWICSSGAHEIFTIRDACLTIYKSRGENRCSRGQNLDNCRNLRQIASCSFVFQLCNDTYDHYFAHLWVFSQKNKCEYANFGIVHLFTLYFCKFTLEF